MFEAYQFRRLGLLASAILAGFAILEGRLFWLQIVRHEELRRKASGFTETTRILGPWRGEIRDRTGLTLAVSKPLVSVVANLTLCTNRPEAVAECLAPLLDQEPTALAGVLSPPALGKGSTNTAPRRAILIKRHVNGEQWDVISNAMSTASFGFNSSSLSKTDLALLRKLQKGALFTEEEQVRVYPPLGSVSLITGYVNEMKQSRWPRGVFGIEGGMDRTLAGTPGLCVSQQDSNGRELAFRRKRFVAPVNGKDVVLTIDLNIQQITERALWKAAATHSPSNASVLVMRPRTGEILAWASWPGFVPPGPDGKGAGDGRNHALSDRYEPGSTFKIFTLAAGLNEGLIGLDDSIFCGNGRFSTNRTTVHDHIPHGWLTVRQAVAKSSNIAFAKVALKLGGSRLHDYLRDFGFGQASGIPLISESAGYLPDAARCSEPMTLVRLGFGQAVAVSQLQMLLAVCAICNDGRLMKPMLVSRLENAEGQVLQRFEPQAVRAVVSPRTARQVREALQLVVSEQGTGSRARLASHSCGGKTGTAQKSDKTGYLPGKYYSSFIGFFPVEEPEICISVAFDEPQNGFYGGDVAAPVFRIVAEQVGAYLGIPADKEVTRGKSMAEAVQERNSLTNEAGTETACITGARPPVF